MTVLVEVAPGTVTVLVVVAGTRQAQAASATSLNTSLSPGKQPLDFGSESFELVRLFRGLGIMEV